MPSKRVVKGGMVVLFEGIDGVGKTTQQQLAAEALQAEGWQVHTTRNLGGTPIGEALRDVTLSDTPRSPETDLYISVAIQVALAKDLATQREKGSIVLLDRGPLSLAAYHIYGSGVAPELGWRYAKAGMEQLRPELAILYEADIGLALRRARSKPAKADYFESKPRSYFERVNQGFDEAGRRYKAKKIIVNTSIDSIHRQTMELIESALEQSAAKH